MTRKAVLRRLLREARPYYPRLFLSLLLGAIAGTGVLAFAPALRLLVNRVIDDRNHDLGILFEILIGLFIVNLISNAASYGSNYLTAWSGQRLIASLRVRLFSRVLHLPLVEFDKWRSGEFLARFTNDLALMTDAMSIALPQLVQVVITFIGSLAFMFYTDWLLTVLLILIAPVISFAVAKYTGWISAGTVRAQERIADLTSNLSEVLQNERVVKAFGRELFETRRFEASNDRFFGAYIKLTQIGQMQSPVVGMIVTVTLLLIIGISAREVIWGRMNQGDVFQFWTLVALTINPMNRIASFIGDLSRGLVGATRIYEILDLPLEPADIPNAIDLTKIDGRIEFDHVRFSYGNAVPVLEDFSVTIGAGEVIALVGPSGAGKTTIVNLVPRFYELGAGTIRLDGVDIKALKLAQLRAAIAIVPQEPLLFNGTIAENIRYGRLDASMADIERAAQDANATEFIAALPEGYDTLIGERGIRLSGGQRQRMAIARAIVREPRILILDEATSALDSHSERLIEAALDTILSGRTTLIIAHRLSTIRRASRIFYIEGGRVCEAGTHDELMVRGGAYARLHAVQFAT